MFRHILILLLMLCLPLQVAAQTLLGKKVESKQTAPIREEPPSGYFRLPGEELGKTQTSNHYTISKERTLQYLFSTQTWVYLQPSAPGQNDEPSGWTYWGETGSADSPNFSIASEASQSSSGQE